MNSRSIKESRGGSNNKEQRVSCKEDCSELGGKVVIRTVQVDVNKKKVVVPFRFEQIKIVLCTK